MWLQQSIAAISYSVLDTEIFQLRYLDKTTLFKDTELHSSLKTVSVFTAVTQKNITFITMHFVGLT